MHGSGCTVHVRMYVHVRLYQELREAVETKLKEGKRDVEETEGTRRSSALGALQNQLAAISKVVHSQ